MQARPLLNRTEIALKQNDNIKVFCYYNVYMTAEKKFLTVELILTEITNTKFQVLFILYVIDCVDKFKSLGHDGIDTRNRNYIKLY